MMIDMPADCGVYSDDMIADEPANTTLAYSVVGDIQCTLLGHPLLQSMISSATLCE